MELKGMMLVLLMFISFNDASLPQSMCSGGFLIICKHVQKRSLLEKSRPRYLATKLFGKQISTRSRRSVAVPAPIVWYIQACLQCLCVVKSKGVEYSRRYLRLQSNGRWLMHRLFLYDRFFNDVKALNLSIEKMIFECLFFFLRFSFHLFLFLLKCDSIMITNVKWSLLSMMSFCTWKKTN